MDGGALAEAMPARMVLLPQSATQKTPALFMPMPPGYRNRALAPAPSELPPAPAWPATVVTTQLVPDGATRRTVWLPESSTYRLVLASTAIDWGWLKRALELVPSALPQTPPKPASVLTTPAGVTLRIVWLRVSAT